MKGLKASGLVFFAWLALSAWAAGVARTESSAAANFTPTSTFDPFVETPLPPHPTELQLGANLYWHWCMPCHGDHGQGLTDEFRGLWEEDHQNCWGRGCHGGRVEDEGFPIPTVVPALADSARMERFSSRQELANYLQATHPPQSPGILKSEEYQAIALFALTLSGRTPAAAEETRAPLPTAALRETTARRGWGWGLAFFGAAVLSALLVVFLASRKST